ncbi:MAG: ribose 5-phosphate isomerase B [Gemmatimonadetes bacterium]|nr:ribose 5-phosphate isomerase B [Gemmatimonadota bacterium]
MSRTIVTEDVVRAAARRGRAIRLGPGDALAPGARTLAQQLGVRIENSPEAAAPAGARVVALGADHGGFKLKEELKAALLEQGYAVQDLGCHTTEAVDYPDYARAVAEAVARGQAWRGIMVDGAGIGSAMVANKVAGVRASLCYDLSTARNAREHNNANVLTLGGALIGPTLARQIVELWLATEFAGGRHERRVAKIDALDAGRRR